mmetsp:Transcript_37507/g.86537  ORF Transcript_37507/g.86537 Transcript_37507/m.86537 type:complete len:446 (+) Transcript_37507:85-1422(+)
MAATALHLGAIALEQIQNIGQLGELAQGHVHQREQIQWTRRSYALDAHALRLDALDHAKGEIKSHYETYVSRIDTLLLVLALIWPFALNVIQFSDPFVPDVESKGIAGQHPALFVTWVSLIAIILVLPFWGILMLIRCKLRLDSWLEFALAGVNRERRDLAFVETPPQVDVRETVSHGQSLPGDLPSRVKSVPNLPNHSQSSSSTLQKLSLGISQKFTPSGPTTPDTAAKIATADRTDAVVQRLVFLVFEYEDHLATIWADELGWLVHASTVLLWLSVVAALALTSMSVGIFLVNKHHGRLTPTSLLFMVIIGAGLLCPGIYVLRYNSRKDAPKASLEMVTNAKWSASSQAGMSFRGPSARFSSDDEYDISSVGSQSLHRLAAPCDGRLPSCHGVPQRQLKRQWSHRGFLGLCLRRHVQRARAAQEPLLETDDRTDNLEGVDHFV